MLLITPPFLLLPAISLSSVINSPSIPLVTSGCMHHYYTSAAIIAASYIESQRFMGIENKMPRIATISAFPPEAYCSRVVLDHSTM